MAQSIHMEKTISTVEMARMTSEELRGAALTVTRQLSLALTRYAAAKDAVDAGDKVLASKYLIAAKEAYSTHLAGETAELAKVREVVAVVKDRGAAQSVTAPGGKDVVKLAMSKTSLWSNSWIAR